MKKIRPILIIILGALLVGCATMQRAQPPSVAIAKTPQQRTQQLQQLQSWNIKGVLGISQSNRTMLANLAWQQQGRQYNIRITGPLQLGGVQITGVPGRVRLVGGPKGVQTATSPEALLQQEVGFQLPISNLYYWIRSLPAPRIPARTKFDAQGRLISLQQQGWDIQYQAYQTVNGLDLPSRMLLTNSDLRVKMVIKQWVISWR